MKKILVLGAGKSSGVLINYLLQHAEKNNWRVFVADIDVSVAAKLINNNSRGEAHAINTSNEPETLALITQVDVVVSMLPPALHPFIANLCLQARKHLVTPSYISDAMQQFHQDAEANGLLFLNEMGLDPGIDHMSAFAMIEEVKKAGGVITGFKSHCGGLIAKDSVDNPWQYKFTWNPRNVVLAGQGDKPIQWLQNDKVEKLSYKELFASAQQLTINNRETFDTYPNRDSLSYSVIYGLNNADTFYRGTLRYKGFCSAWQFIVRLGLCDDIHIIKANDKSTFNALISSLTGIENNESFVKNVAAFLGVREDDSDFQKLVWLGLFDNINVDLNAETAAQALQHLLEEKWKLNYGDKDRVVMVHELIYKLNGKIFLQTATLDIEGTTEHTAMASTVGLPIAIAVKNILNGGIKKSGVLRPIFKDIYEPILQELKQFGIVFQHHTAEV